MTKLPALRLMIPGPGQIDDDVIAIMGRPIAAHYGPDWATLYKETIDLMKKVFLTQSDVLFHFCSGQAAVEAGMGSLFAPDESVLIVNNGFFGHRLGILAEALGLNKVELTAKWGDPITPSTLRKALLANPNVKGICAVHHDTSTGRLNPIQAYGQIAQEFDLPLIVDAIASAGGDPLFIDDWHIDICVTAGNKCLGAPVGWAAISVSDKAWSIMDQKSNVAAGWYLNLKMWRDTMEAQGDWHPTPVTVSSHNLEALHLVLTKICEEGLENRWQRFKNTAVSFREEMKKRGFSLFMEGDEASSAITAVHCPLHMDNETLVAALRDQHQIQISSGIANLREKIWRIGHLGNAEENIPAFLKALDTIKF